MLMIQMMLFSGVTVIAGVLMRYIVVINKQIWVLWMRNVRFWASRVPTPMTYFGRWWRLGDGVSHLRRWSPVGWGPIACRCSGGSRWVCGRFSCRRYGRVRRADVRSDPPPTPWLLPTVHARFSPWIHTRHTHIICLCDLETVREHGVAVVYLCTPELHA